MALSRRDFLRIGGLAAVTTTASGCSVIGRQLAKNELPQTLTIPESTTAPISTTAVSPLTAIDPIQRILNRAGYGPRPGEVERVQAMGLAAYLEEQLYPDEIEDNTTDLLMRNLTLYQMDANQLAEQEEKDGAVELIGSTLSRALYSKRQLYEAMVEFWSDHFNIYIRKNQPMPLLKILDDRDTIRPHALGKFRDLLFASAKSPAMLVYLDNIKNEKSAPNENYARELLELHTVGVNGGYTQQDIQELARALTGWTVGRRGRNTAKWVFKPNIHDNEAKIVMGLTLPAGQGEQDVEQVLEMLATHPSTAVFIATKLVRRFVADDPPADLVETVSQTFQETDGDIKSMLRDIFLSEEFGTAPPKLKRPFTYMVSVLRALHVDLRLGRRHEIGRWMQLLGQPLFNWPPPNGYPDVSAAWTSNLLPRWNFALAILHNEINDMTPPLEEIITSGNATTPQEVLNLFAGLVYGRSLTADEQSLFYEYVGDGTLDNRDTQTRLKDAVALMLASPAFQWT